MDTGRRAALVPIVLAGLSMIGPFSIDTAFPAFGAIERDLAVGPSVTQQLVSSYLLAFALMSLLHGPLSDALGRKPVMLGGLALYALASIGCALAPNMLVLLAFRTLQGLTAGAATVVSRAVVRDLYEGAQAQQLMSRVMMIFGLAPALAPVIGGWLLLAGSWRVVFVFLVVFAVGLAVVVVLVMPETLPAEARTRLAPRTIASGLAEVARNGQFQILCWAAAFSFGAIFLYIGSAAIFVVGLLGKGEQDFWVFFVPMIAGMVTGSWFSGRAAGRIPGRRLVTWSLAWACGGAVLNLAGAILAGPALPWAVLWLSLAGVGVSAAFPTLQLAALDLFPGHRGAAASLGAFCALVLNAAGAGLLAPVVTGSVVSLAAVALGYLLLGAALWAVHCLSSPAREQSPGLAEAYEPET